MNLDKFSTFSHYYTSLSLQVVLVRSFEEKVVDLSENGE